MTRRLLVKADETAELNQHDNVIFCDVLVYAERKYGTIMCDQFFFKNPDWLGWIRNSCKFRSCRHMLYQLRKPKGDEKCMKEPVTQIPELRQNRYHSLQIPWVAVGFVPIPY